MRKMFFLKDFPLHVRAFIIRIHIWNWKKIKKLNMQRLCYFNILKFPLFLEQEKYQKRRKCSNIYRKNEKNWLQIVLFLILLQEKNL